MAKTFNDFFMECETFKYSQEYFELCRLESEINMINLYLENQEFYQNDLPEYIKEGYDVEDGYFMEADDPNGEAKQNAQNAGEEKAKSFLTKIADGFKYIWGVIAKFFRSLFGRSSKVIEENKTKYVNVIKYFQTTTNFSEDQKQKMIKIINDATTDDLVNLCRIGKALPKNADCKLGNLMEILPNIFNNYDQIEICPITKKRDSKNIILSLELCKILQDTLEKYFKDVAPNKVNTENLMHVNREANLGFIDYFDKVDSFEINLGSEGGNKQADALDEMAKYFGEVSDNIRKGIGTKIRQGLMSFLNGNAAKPVKEMYVIARIGAMNMAKLYRDLIIFKNRATIELAKLDFVSNNNPQPQSN